MRASVGDASLVCKEIPIVASAVDYRILSQQSHGQRMGTRGGGFVDCVLSAAQPINYMVSVQSIVVPLGFFVNKDVTAKTCSSSAAANKGLQCVTDADCGGTAGSCASATLDNVSRPMVVNIFSGSAWYWTDFGAGFNSKPITACLRHAGAGTHSTLDYAVMNPLWGASLAVNESASEPTMWFNDSSADEMKCINGISGAIGYADADQLTGTGAATYPNVAAVKYQGYEPKRVNIRNGLYDAWSFHMLYFDTYYAPYFSNGVYRYIFNKLNDYVNNPNNISLSSLEASANYWAPRDEMVYMKGVDWYYPVYCGASKPVAP